MWIGAPFAWLMPAIIPEKHRKPGDERTMQVRARRAKDLDLLRALYMQGTLGPTIFSPDKDYEFRAYCKPEEFAWAAFQMVMDIDYAKFKPTTDRFSDDQLHGMYNAMWSLIQNRLSEQAHRDRYWSAVDKKYPPKKYVGATAPATGNGYPKAIGPVTGEPAGKAHAVAGSADDDGYAGLQQWLYEQELKRPSQPRDTRADRDQYNPEVWDTETPVTTGIPVVDDLYTEIDKILDGYKSLPFEHDTCAHSVTRSARKKCNNKRRREAEAQIRAIREDIDRAYRDAEADASWESGYQLPVRVETVEIPVDPALLGTAPAPAAIEGEVVTGPNPDPATWRGFVWERRKADASL